MPVSFDSYDEDVGRMDLSEGSNAHAVLSFLAETPEKGFTPEEIHEGTGIPYGSVGPTLQRLAKRDLVRHKAPYWAIGEERELAYYSALDSSVEAAESRLGSEDPAEWLKHATPLDDE